MKASILSVALGVVLSGPAAAYTIEQPAKPAHSQPAGYHSKPFWAYGWSHHHRRPPRTDGLSGRASACVTYGCVGAGGDD
jgi:hypothetical protein